MASHPPSTASVRSEILPGIWLDSRLALWLPAEGVLVVADLHWGYAASHRARGNLLPWWGDGEIEQRLEALLGDYHPAEMIWLGDCVHAAEGAARAEAFLRRSPVPITALAGNHDRRWRSAVQASAVRGSYFFHHGDTTPAQPPACVEVIGHHHPAVSWGDGAGSRLKLPALVVSARQLILPAFSPWAAGSPWSVNPERKETLWAIAPTRIFPVSRNNVVSGVDVS
ncbi:MAG: metallophosphoesterase [Opitutaceae bacterium]